VPPPPKTAKEIARDLENERAAAKAADEAAQRDYEKRMKELEEAKATREALKAKREEERE